jgi:serine/threonine protein kinase/predicted ATPase/GTPase SAR1 family protein
MEFCPVCMLRNGLASRVESGEASSEDTVKPTFEHAEQRFEHYELLTGEDGKPIELGHGGMGVTYKALDVNLQCAVALKVIKAEFIGDESARRRFVREARAAASVRHPNVASVFHLGTSGNNYFYAMEFVDGESLDQLIQNSGRLQVDLALEIVTQVACGICTVHKQKLVHRDIKPGNIMVGFEGDTPIAKIIDLGLAKVTAESQSETAVSIPGSFAGTPEFASPEQFAGIGVDIRSDLYSLGVTLWSMIAGRPPFRGTSAELMHQHLHAELPLEQLNTAPQPVVALLEVLLEKDPARRFQSPTELLHALPAIKEAIDTERAVTPQNLRRISSIDRTGTIRNSPVRRAPEKISVARLPITTSQVFGREDDIAFLDAAWADPEVNIVTIVAWAGVGKSTLVNHWLRQLAPEQYRFAQLVFGWSFYRQGTSGGASSADEFIDAALRWFGDPDPRIGTAWEKGERLAKLVARRRSLLILDGLEPLQNPPGPQEGRVREPSLQALLRELAVFNPGLCVVTTQLPVADIADHEGSSAQRRDLEHLSSNSGAQLLRALGVKGEETELQSASEEFSGHSLALTLLGSYLTDAFGGDIRFRKEVSQRLVHDVRQGVHARKVMESYQSWFGDGPELSVLRLLGFFDRPADEQALKILLKPPAIPGLTESLTGLSPSDWRAIVARLRRARLLAGEDPHNPGQLDTHPLVREYFGEQLRSDRTEAWKEGNRRLYHHYRALAAELPDSVSEIRPLFLAVVCGCNAGRFREALHETYIPRIQRGNASFAANFAADVLGARGAVLTVLAHFFENGRWGSWAETSIDRQSLDSEDQLFILIQAGLYLIHTRGMSSPEAEICCERAELLSRLLNRPLALYVALIGQFCYSLMTDKLAATTQIAKRVHALAQEQNDSALMVGAYRCLTVTSYYSGDFGSAREYAMRGLQIWRSRGVKSLVEELIAPPVECLCYQALSEWHLAESASHQATMAEAIALAKELNNMPALGLALYWAGLLAHFEGNPAEVERLASALIELSTRQTFASWLPGGVVLRGWARSALGDTVTGISWIGTGIREYQATGAILRLPYFLALKAEALHLANRTNEALEAIRNAEAMVEKTEGRWWSAELHRLRGVFLAALGGGETQIETSFDAAIQIAMQQRSVSLLRRAEASSREFRSQRGGKKEGRDATHTITQQSLGRMSSHKPAAASSRPAKPGPKKISIARLPVTGSHIFGREEDLAFLNAAWANQQINVVTVVAWAGVGKSTLVNHWLRRLAAEQYRSAQLVFGWSFYRQGTSGGTLSADEFIDAALKWFGDPDPRIGTAWEKGERLAKLIALRRTLLVLDGLEPLQNPPGPQEGRLRDPTLQALLRDLAAFNKGLCVITTRTAVADIADHEGTSALRRDLEQLSSAAGAQLLGALGVKGHVTELQTASEEFGGHCLALTLLGSFLTDACGGDVRRRKEVSEHLVEDIRQGVHARKVMGSYQNWFGEGPELSILRMLGLFDRPVDEKVLLALVTPPAVRGLTETLVSLDQTRWRAILARLRRARLLAGEDPHNPGYVDTHPLVREYFGEQLRSQWMEAWKECNSRLFNYYRELAPQLPGTVPAMEPLFLAAIFGCNAGLFRDTLHEVYIPRIQRGNASFAANILGARGALLSVLIHFFEHGRWGSPIDAGVEGQELTVEDQLFILMQARLYLTATRGLASPEARFCCERAESLCRSLDHRPVLYSTLKGQFFYSLMTANLTATMQIAKRVHSLAQEQNDPALMVGAYECLAVTLYFCGDFYTAHESAVVGVQNWRSGTVQSQVEELMAPGVVCLCYKALTEWHLGEAASYQMTIAEAVSVAKQLHDMHALVLVHYWSTYLAYLEGDFAKVGRLASDLMETSTRLTFGTWLPHGRVLEGWARAASGSIAEGLSSIEDGIVQYRAAGAILALPFFQTLKADALHLVRRTSEALAALEEGETVVERSGAHVWSAELYRLRGVFLQAIGADEAQIEASFREAINTARAQKSISLAARAEASYLEYRRQKGKR